MCIRPKVQQNVGSCLQTASCVSHLARTGDSGVVPMRNLILDNKPSCLSSRRIDCHSFPENLDGALRGPTRALHDDEPIAGSSCSPQSGEGMTETCHKADSCHSVRQVRTHLVVLLVACCLIRVSTSSFACLSVTACDFSTSQFRMAFRTIALTIQ